MSLNYTPVNLAKKGGPELEPTIPRSPTHVEGDAAREKAIPPEPGPDKEGPDHVITEHPESVVLTDDLKAAGVESVPNPTSLLPEMPVTDEVVYDALDAPIESPKRWFGEYWKKALLKAGVLLKKVRGHVQRVIKPTS